MKLIWQIIERLTALVIFLNIFDASSEKLTDIIITGQDSNQIIVFQLVKQFFRTLKKLCKNAKPRSCCVKSFQETFLEKNNLFQWCSWFSWFSWFFYKNLSDPWKP